jgi:hypothetical protein
MAHVGEEDFEVDTGREEISNLEEGHAVGNVCYECQRG